MPALSGMRRAIELNIAVRHGQAWLLWPLSGLGILIFSLSLGRCNGVLGACTALPIMHVKRQVGGWWRKHGCGPQYPVGTVRLSEKSSSCVGSRNASSWNRSLERAPPHLRVVCCMLLSTVELSAPHRSRYSIGICVWRGQNKSNGTRNNMLSILTDAALAVADCNRRRSRSAVLGVSKRGYLSRRQALTVPQMVVSHRRVIKSSASSF